MEMKLNDNKQLMERNMNISSGKEFATEKKILKEKLLTLNTSEFINKKRQKINHNHSIE